MRGSTWSRLVCLEWRRLCCLLIRRGLIVVKVVISACPIIPIEEFIGGGVWRRSIVVVVAVIDKDIVPVRGATSRIHLLSLRIFGGAMIVCAVGGCSVTSSRAPFIIESTYIFRRVALGGVWHEGGVAAVARRGRRRVLFRIVVRRDSRCGAKAWRRMAGTSCMRGLQLRSTRTRGPAVH